MNFSHSLENEKYYINSRYPQNTSVWIQPCCEWNEKLWKDSFLVQHLPTKLLKSNS